MKKGRSKAKLKPNEFQCAACQNVYENGQTIEEAENEFKELFGSLEQSKVLVCHDCWLQMMEYHRKQN